VPRKQQTCRRNRGCQHRWRRAARSRRCSMCPRASRSESRDRYDDLFCCRIGAAWKNRLGRQERQRCIGFNERGSAQNTSFGLRLWCALVLACPKVGPCSVCCAEDAASQVFLRGGKVGLNGCFGPVFAKLLKSVSKYERRAERSVYSLAKKALKLHCSATPAISTDMAQKTRCKARFTRSVRFQGLASPAAHRSTIHVDEVRARIASDTARTT